MKKKDRKKVLKVFRKIISTCNEKECESGKCPHVNECQISTQICDAPYLWNIERIEDWLRKEEFDD